MSEPFQPTPPALLELIKEEAETRLSPDQFRAYIAGALDPASKEESQSLIDWFTRRYRTPAERLAYARGMARSWKRPFLRGGPTKLVDVQEVLEQIPDLSSLELVGREGVLKGRSFKLDAQGGWSTHLSGFFDYSNIHEDITLDCGLGTVVLQGAVTTGVEKRFTRATYDGSVSGQYLELTLTRRPPVPDEPLILRTFIAVDESLPQVLAFPWAIDDPRSGTRRALLPIKGKFGELDVYYLKERAFLVLEAGQRTSDPGAYRAHVPNVRLLLAYFCGQPNRRVSIEAAYSSRTGEALEVTWYPPGAASTQGAQRAPIPADRRSWYRAQEALGLADPSDVGPFKPDIVGRCLDTLIANPDLQNPLRFLIEARSLPVELAGALYVIALESVVKHVERRQRDAPRRQPVPSGQLLPDETWQMLHDALLTAAAPALAAMSPARREAILGRLGNLNQEKSSHTDKLLGAFESMQVPLREAERAAIRERNKLIHEGRLIPTARRSDRGANHEAFEVEWRLYTAINKLLLKCLGYEGPVCDWGENPWGEKQAVFVLV